MKNFLTFRLSNTLLVLLAILWSFLSTFIAFTITFGCLPAHACKLWNLDIEAILFLLTLGLPSSYYFVLPNPIINFIPYPVYIFMSALIAYLLLVGLRKVLRK